MRKRFGLPRSRARDRRRRCSEVDTAEAASLRSRGACAVVRAVAMLAMLVGYGFVAEAQEVGGWRTTFRFDRGWGPVSAVPGLGLESSTYDLSDSDQYADYSVDGNEYSQYRALVHTQGVTVARLVRPDVGVSMSVYAGGVGPEVYIKREGTVGGVTAIYRYEYRPIGFPAAFAFIPGMSWRAATSRIVEAWISGEGVVSYQASGTRPGPDQSVGSREHRGWDLSQPVMTYGLRTALELVLFQHWRVAPAVRAGLGVSIGPTLPEQPDAYFLFLPYWFAGAGVTIR
jgi:hypothetical protein